MHTSHIQRVLVWRNAIRCEEGEGREKQTPSRGEGGKMRKGRKIKRIVKKHFHSRVYLGIVRYVAWLVAWK